MKKLFITFMFVFLSSQASAWVSKEFIPSKVSLINVFMSDQATDGCWTNIGEVKRYVEDKLELVGFKVSREKFEGYENDKHFILSVMVNAKRTTGKCFGDVEFEIIRYIKNNNMGGMFLVGQYGSNFKGGENANQYTLKLTGEFMKEVEAPQW